MGISWYVWVKIGEAVFWLSCAAYFLVRGIRGTGSGRIDFGVAAAFTVFGLADAVEYWTAGALPWWLWVWKIVGGLSLFGFLVAEDHARRGAPALAWYRFVGAGLVLAWALILMYWSVTHGLYGDRRR